MQSKIDTYLSRISHVSQFVLVAFAIFGYFYTVRPIYQKELLSEDIASKQVELNSLGQELSKKNQQLKNQKDKEISLLNNIADLKNSFVLATDELKSIQLQVANSKLELDKQKKFINALTVKNKKYLSDTYFENFSGLVSQYYLKKIYTSMAKDNKITPNLNEVQDYLGTPYDAIRSTLDSEDYNFFDSNKNVPDSLKRVIRNYIESNLKKDKLKLQGNTQELIVILNAYNNKRDEIEKGKGVEKVDRMYDLDREFTKNIDKIQRDYTVRTTDYIKNLSEKFR